MARPEKKPAKPVELGRSGPGLSFPSGLPFGRTRDEIPYEPLHLQREGKALEEVLAAVRADEKHPDRLAANLIERALSEVHQSVHEQSPTLSRFVFLVRDLLADHLPGMTLEQMLEGLHAALSSRGGGRSPVEDDWRDWLQRYEALRARRPTLTAQERYEDILEEWHNEGHKAPKTWQGIRDGISKLKRKNKGV